MDRFVEIAAKHHCSRIEWTTGQDNERAQRFYDELDVPVNKSKWFCRLEQGFLANAPPAHHAELVRLRHHREQPTLAPVPE